MEKLGFIIEYSQDGIHTLSPCNGGAWEKEVKDIREYTKYFEDFADEGKYVTILSFDTSGCFLTLLKAAQGGRDSDFFSVWVYIPNTIEITQEEITNVYNYVTDILHNCTTLKDKEQEIKEYFSKEYAHNKIPGVYRASSSEEKFAVRYIDGNPYTIYEILDKRYQRYYSDYKAIFLLEKGVVNLCKNVMDKFDDITSTQHETYLIIEKPTKEQLRAWKADEVLIDNEPFESPVYVKAGEKVKLCFKRDSFEDYNTEYTIKEHTHCITNIQPTWKKLIKPSMFNVIDKNSREKIDNPKIFIHTKENDIELNSLGILLKECELKNVKVRIKSPKYEDREEKIDFTQCSPYEVRMQRKINSISCIATLGNGNLAKMTLESEYLDEETDYLIPGYTIGDKETWEKDGKKYVKLKRTSNQQWKNIAYGVGGTLILELVIVMCIGISTWFDNHDLRLGWPPYKTQNIEESNTEDGQDTEQTNTVSTDALAYLDDNGVWNKNEMEEFDDLKGLYDDLNNYNFKSIKNNWEPKLETSRKFREIWEILKANEDKFSQKGTYGTNDGKISVENYKKKLEKFFSTVNSK